MFFFSGMEEDRDGQAEVGRDTAPARAEREAGGGTHLRGGKAGKHLWRRTHSGDTSRVGCALRSTTQGTLPYQEAHTFEAKPAFLATAVL